jgi:gamma-glutamylcyclotransferase (GGCT)/AIG2-like uncharacterized protein YtfP
MSNLLTAVFAYGTLRRGFCRASCWPKAPRQVDTAFVQGSLVDVGPYPGLLPGLDWIRGELWQLAPEDIQETLSVLDDVEGYVQHENENLYQRIVIDVYATPGGPFWAQAYTYHLVRPDLVKTAIEVPMRFRSDGMTYTEWPDRLS